MGATTAASFTADVLASASAAASIAVASGGTACVVAGASVLIIRHKKRKRRQAKEKLAEKQHLFSYSPYEDKVDQTTLMEIALNDADNKNNTKVRKRRKLRLFGNKKEAK